MTDLTDQPAWAENAPHTTIRRTNTSNNPSCTAFDMFRESTSDYSAGKHGGNFLWLTTGPGPVREDCASQKLQSRCLRLLFSRVSFGRTAATHINH